MDVTVGARLKRKLLDVTSTYYWLLEMRRKTGGGVIDLSSWARAWSS
jgi:hypothetical protein